MVPVVLLQLAGLPLSANGKLDRKALPLPDLTPRVKGRAPQSATEIAVAAAFSRLLGCEINDVESDFFALGGHSLLAMKLAAQLSQTFNRQVTPGQVMVASDVAQLISCSILTMTNARAIWGSGRCCRCVKAMVQRYFVSIRRRGSPGNLAYYHAISARRGRLWGFSRRAPLALCKPQPLLMRYVNIIWRLCSPGSRMALIIY